MKYKPAIVIAYMTSQGLPEPVQEYQFALEIGRKWRFDFAWPIHMVALEVEGGVFIRGAHGSISGIKRDMEKYNAAAYLGWWVLRVLPENLCMMDTIRMLKRAMDL